jgi:hypothetical protein
MATWRTPPSLVSLRREFNIIAPKRDKASDGSIGDKAHARRSSDHNLDESGVTPDEDIDRKDEAHAIDVDKDLKEVFTMQDCVNFILSECRKPNSVGKDKGRLKFIVYNRKMYKAPYWKPVKYKGPNPHTKHAHFSAEYGSRYSEDDSSWGLVEKFGKKRKA